MHTSPWLGAGVLAFAASAWTVWGFFEQEALLEAKVRPAQTAALQILVHCETCRQHTDYLVHHASEADREARRVAFDPSCTVSGEVFDDAAYLAGFFHALGQAAARDGHADLRQALRRIQGHWDRRLG